MANTTTSCTSSGDALRPPLCEQIGGEQRRLVALPLPDTRNQCGSGGIGELVKLALQRRGRGLGVEAGRGDVLVAEKTLQIGDVHAQREQAGGYSVPKQVRVNALADPGGAGDGANDLADALAGQHMWRWPGPLLAAGERRPRTPGAGVQPKQFRE